MKRLKFLLWLSVVTSLLAISALSLPANDAIVDSNITKATQKKVLIDPLSIRPLYLIQVNGNQVLGMATGFVVQKANDYYLITNWHVLSGRHPSSNEMLNPTGKTPDSLLIWHHGKQLGSWVRKKEALYDNTKNKRWLEHTTGRAVDIVALPLKILADDVQLYPLDLSLANADMVPQVAMPVSIIGFPVGLTSAGFFPIWKTGHIASEPNLDFHGEPLFLIDATTRGGMSGSPVVLRLSGSYKTKDGNTIMGSSGYRTLFLGVYSGRLPGDSEIGRVWRPRLINDILP